MRLVFADNSSNLFYFKDYITNKTGKSPGYFL